MYRKNRILVVAASIAFLAACGGERSASWPAQTRSTDAGAAAAADTPDAAGGRQARRKALASLSDPTNSLILRPGGIDRCSPAEGPIAVEVTWDASALGTEGVHIFLQNPGEARKLWSSAGAKGSETTGPWIQNGSTVTLVNAADNQEVATLEMKDVPCD